MKTDLRSVAVWRSDTYADLIKKYDRDAARLEERLARALAMKKIYETRQFILDALADEEEV